MRYDIYVTQYNAEGVDFPSYGVEVQPPLGVLAASNICQVLIRDPAEQETNGAREYDAAYVTRDDEEGTAFVVYPNPALHYDFDAVANDMRHVIDPTDKYEIVLHYPGNPDE